MAKQPQISAPEIADDLLPATYRDDSTHSLKLPSSDVSAFLKADLCVEHINRIHPDLWLVGRPYPPRALNLQSVLNRKLVATQDVTLHLVWTSKKIFVKPLPVYMLTDKFYESQLKMPAQCEDALGFLYSYMALVPTILDFDLAQDAHLIPRSYQWQHWKALTQRILNDYEDQSIYQHIPHRYVYGELRLGRLDKIYRYLRGNVFRGYSPLTGSTRYIDFFAENLAIVAAATVYVALVLTAMQVGLGTRMLTDSDAFQRASSGFAIFSILSPILALIAVTGVFLAMFFVNLIRTVHVKRDRFRTLGIESRQMPKLTASTVNGQSA